MRYKTITLISLVCLIVSGCATTQKISYKLEPKHIMISDVTHPLKVGVVTFEDLRLEIERSHEKRKETFHREYGLYSADKEFREIPVVLGISQMLAKHLEFSKIFKETKFIEFLTQDTVQTQTISEEIKIAYDAVLTGKVKHFYGYHKPNLAVKAGLAPLMVFGALGGAIYGGVAASVKEPIEAHTYIIEISLVNTKNYNVLWQGEVECYIKESERCMDPQRAAIRSLKEAVNKLVVNLSTAEIKF